MGFFTEFLHTLRTGSAEGWWGRSGPEDLPPPLRLELFSSRSLPWFVLASPPCRAGEASRVGPSVPGLWSRGVFMFPFTLDHARFLRLYRAGSHVLRRTECNLYFFKHHSPSCGCFPAFLFTRGSDCGHGLDLVGRPGPRFLNRGFAPPTPSSHRLGLAP